MKYAIIFRAAVSDNLFIKGFTNEEVFNTTSFGTTYTIKLTDINDLDVSIKLLDEESATYFQH